jgi:type IV pilus assembly protein PilW
MQNKALANHNGVTLIELLVGLVISSMLVGGMYRLFISQSRAYNVQEQVVETQQGTRAAMELLVRDLRMAGYDDSRTAAVTISQPVIPEDHAITVRYEYESARYEARYWIDGSLRLMRQETIGAVSRTEQVLDNVEILDFVYGIDRDEDGRMDDLNGNGILDDWVPAGSVGSQKVVAVRVTLTARPSQINHDLQNVSPRTLISSVTLRNLSMI